MYSNGNLNNSLHPNKYDYVNTLITHPYTPYTLII